jgi:hypothetical protein
MKRAWLASGILVQDDTLGFIWDKLGRMLTPTEKSSVTHRSVNASPLHGTPASQKFESA